MRTRGYNKDFIIDSLLKLGYDFKRNYFFKDKIKYQELIERLAKLNHVVEKRRQLVK